MTGFRVDPWAIGCFALALVSACARENYPTQAQAAQTIVGRSASQVAACMGRPGTMLTTGRRSVWSYTAPGGGGPYFGLITDPSDADFDYTPFDTAHGDPAFQQAITPPPQAVCTVLITMEGGRARALSFVGPDGNALPDAPECSRIALPCFLSHPGPY